MRLRVYLYFTIFTLECLPTISFTTLLIHPCTVRMSWIYRKIYRNAKKVKEFVDLPSSTITYWFEPCKKGISLTICCKNCEYFQVLEPIIRSIWKEIWAKTSSVIVCFPRKSSTTIFYLYFPRLFELIQFRKGLFFWCLFRAQHSLQIPVIFHRTHAAQRLNLVAATLKNGNQST